MEKTTQPKSYYSGPSISGEDVKRENILLDNDAPTHELKTWPEFYNQVAEGLKRFELRKNDRDFQPGDLVILKEWDPLQKRFTGRSIIPQVIRCVFHGSGLWGLEKGYCILSF